MFQHKPPALVGALEDAIQAVREGDVVSPEVAHQRIASMYTWDNVARRTEKVSNVFMLALH